jgi:hypothetical protein
MDEIPKLTAQQWRQIVNGATDIAISAPIFMEMSPAGTPVLAISWRARCKIAVETGCGSKRFLEV